MSILLSLRGGWGEAEVAASRPVPVFGKLNIFQLRNAGKKLPQAILCSYGPGHVVAIRGQRLKYLAIGGA